MAVTETYVDPSIAGDSGTGTIGDPYGDLQYALNTMTQDTTNGDRINIKAGTAEVLAASLSLATYGTPATGYPLIFQGYTSTAGDGGQGAISGAGSYGIFADANLDYIVLADLELYNTGSSDVIDLDNFIGIYNCEIHTTSGEGIDIDGGYIVGCYVYNVGNVLNNGIRIDNGIVYGCYVEYGVTNTPASGIRIGGNAQAVSNIVKCTGSMNGIYTNNAQSSTISNSIFSNGGTGAGINGGSTSGQGRAVVNNVVDGFSGAGGVGISTEGDSTSALELMLSNAVYNCTTAYSKNALVLDVDNDTLGSAPFTDAANGDFSINGTVTGVTEDAFPLTFPEGSTTSAADKGAVQAGAGAGGGGRRPRIRAHGV